MGMGRAGWENAYLFGRPLVGGIDWIQSSVPSRPVPSRPHYAGSQGVALLRHQRSPEMLQDLFGKFPTDSWDRTQLFHGGAPNLFDGTEML